MDLQHLLSALNKCILKFKKKVYLPNECTDPIKLETLLTQYGSLNATEVAQILDALTDILKYRSVRAILCNDGHVEFGGVGIKREIYLMHSSDLNDATLQKVILKYNDAKQAASDRIGFDDSPEKSVNPSATLLPDTPLHLSLLNHADESPPSLAHAVLPENLNVEPPAVYDTNFFFQHFSADQQEAVFQRMLYDRRAKPTLQFPAKNGRELVWFRVRKSIGMITWKNYRRNVLTELLQLLTQTLSGDTALGIQQLARRLYQIDPLSVLMGARQAGAVIMKALSALDTVTIQEYINATDSTMKKLARCLRYHCGGVKVLAGQKKCKAVVQLHPIAYSIRTYEYLQRSDQSEEVVTHTISYRVSSPDEVLTATLQNLRDTEVTATVQIGRNFGTRVGIAIGNNFLMDHGGGEMRFQQAILAVPNTPPININIGGYEAADDYDIILHTCADTIDKGIGVMNNRNVLLLHWGTGFDFAYVPAQVHPIVLPCTGAVPDNFTFERNADGKKVVRWGPGANEMAVFERDDIPNTDINATYVPIVSFQTSDCKALMQSQGRGNHSSCKCPICNMKHTDSNKNDWQAAPAVGHKWTSAIMDAETTLFSATHPTNQTLAAAVNPLQKLLSERASQKSGLTIHRRLFTNLPVENTICPPLHIFMGLVQRAFNAITKFSDEKLEFEEPHVIQALTALRTEEEALRTTRIGLAAIPDARGATPANKAAYLALRINLNAQVKTISKNIVECKSALADARKDRTFWRMRNSLMAIYADYQIVPTAFHSNSLIGEHGRRFVTKWPMICERIETLFKGPLRRLNVEPTIDAQIDYLLHTISCLCAALYVVHTTLYRKALLTPIAQQQFNTAATYLGWKVRKEANLDNNVSIKLHMLESHMPDQMQEYGNIAQFLEESIEVAHHDGNVLNRRYSCFAKWSKRQSLIMKALAQKQHPLVVDYANNIAVGSKRKFSAASLERRSNKAQANDDDEEQRLAGCMLIIYNDFEQV